MSSNALRFMSDKERLKYEAAEELGLLKRLLDVGWGGLTAEETGRIGGIVGRRLRAASSIDSSDE